jgi:hypothetical protein
MSRRISRADLLAERRRVLGLELELQRHRIGHDLRVLGAHARPGALAALLWQRAVDRAAPAASSMRPAWVIGALVNAIGLWRWLRRRGT